VRIRPADVFATDDGAAPTIEIAADSSLLDVRTVADGFDLIARGIGEADVEVRARHRDEVDRVAFTLAIENAACYRPPAGSADVFALTRRERTFAFEERVVERLPSGFEQHVVTSGTARWRIGKPRAYRTRKSRST
jgi:hypothetical protein